MPLLLTTPFMEIIQISDASGTPTVTITTSRNHNLQENMVIEIIDNGGNINGFHTVTSIINPTSFTFTKAGASPGVGGKVIRITPYNITANTYWNATYMVWNGVYWTQSRSQGQLSGSGFPTGFRPYKIKFTFTRDSVINNPDGSPIVEQDMMQFIVRDTDANVIGETDEIKYPVGGAQYTVIFDLNYTTFDFKSIRFNSNQMGPLRNGQINKIEVYSLSPPF